VADGPCLTLVLQAGNVRERVSQLNNVTPEDTAGLKAYQAEQRVSLGSAKVTLAVGDTGALVHLVDDVTQVQWVDANLPFGLFTYRVLNESDWVPFTNAYINGHSEAYGFCKPGSNNYSESTHFYPLDAVIYSNDEDTLVIEAPMPSRCVDRYGSPVYVSFKYTFVRDSSNNLAISLVTKLFGKSPSMIGESGKLLFAPSPKRTGPWRMDKLGQAVDPEDVVVSPSDVIVT
jgi:hypothetical protein